MVSSNININNTYDLILIICLYAVKWFQVLVFNTNNSIRY